MITSYTEKFLQFDVVFRLKNSIVEKIMLFVEAKKSENPEADGPSLYMLGKKKEIRAVKEQLASLALGVIAACPKVRTKHFLQELANGNVMSVEARDFFDEDRRSTGRPARTAALIDKAVQ